jgi:hypothetical protein
MLAAMHSISHLVPVLMTILLLWHSLQSITLGFLHQAAALPPPDGERDLF